ncbi:hypothetical protein D3C73_1235670 [compost metagenome]
MTDAAAKACIGQRQGLVLLLIQLAGEPRVVTKAADGIADIPLRFGQRLAVVAHFQFRQGLLAAFEFVGQRLQPLRAFSAGGLAPAIVEGSPGGAHGVIDVFFGACCYAMKRLAGGRVDDVQVTAQVRADPLAVDVKLITHGETPGCRNGGFAGDGK